MCEEKKENIEELEELFKANQKVAILYKIFKYYTEKNNIDKLYEFALEGIKLNDSYSYYILGIILTASPFGKYDFENGINYLQKAVELNYIEAYKTLASAYLSDERGHADYNKALYYIKKYDELNNSVSYDLLAKTYFYLYDYKNALEYALIAVKTSPDIHFYLGYIYADFKGNYLNYRLAVEHYTKSLEYVELSGSYNNLAILYAEGFGVEKDENKAFELMSKAYKLGSQISIRNLASYYRNGFGCTKDLNKAFELMNEIEDKENGEYLYSYALNYCETKQYDKAIEYLKKGAALGDINCKYKLGSIYSDIYKKRISYFDSSITKETIYEIFNEIYQKGLEISKEESFKSIFLDNCLLNSSRDFVNERRKINDSKAYAISKMVGNKNFSDIYRQIDLDEWELRGLLGVLIYDEICSTSLDCNKIYIYEDCLYSNINYILGRKYEIGYRVEKNIEKAIQQYEKAIKNGHPMAYSRLAFLYQYGIGVEKDEKKAEQYHCAAATDALIGDTHLNYYDTYEHRGVVYSQVALGEIEEKKADKIDDVYVNHKELISADLVKIYDKKRSYQNAIIYFDNAFKSGTLHGKIAYVNFYLRHPDLYGGNNLEDILEEIKEKADSIEILKYYLNKGEHDIAQKIKLNILNSNEIIKIEELLKIYEERNEDISIILLKLSSLGDEKSFYRYKLLGVEKDSEEFKKIIYEMADINIYDALLKALEYEPNNEVYLHKVLDDPRIMTHLEIKNKYRPILGDIYFSRHNYEMACQYLDDPDKLAISLFLAKKSIENTFLNDLVLASKNISSIDAIKNCNNSNLLVQNLKEYMQKYSYYRKTKEYYTHQFLLTDKKIYYVNHILEYINENTSVGYEPYQLLITLLYSESYSYMAKKVSDEKLKEILYQLGIELGSYYCKYNYAYLLYKNNPGFLKSSIRKQAIKMMDQMQSYFKPAYEFLLKYEKKSAKSCNDRNEIKKFLLIGD